jgi:DNA-binding SARP family transcriptional activator
VTNLLRLRVLGPLRAEAAGRAIPLGPLKQRMVLATLLCHPNTPVSVDLLTDAVWNDDPPRTARKNLQMYVSALRKALAQAGAGDRLSLRHGGYVLSVQPDELDSLRARALAESGREAAAAGDTGRAVRLLHEARTLWAGPPMPELNCSAVIRAEVERLTARHLAVCEDWAEAALEAGRPREVAEVLGELAERHPLRERLRASQMTALYRSGRRAEALAVYDEVRQRLSRELGLPPSPPLESLYRAIVTDADAGATRQRSPRPAVTSALPADLAEFTGRAAQLEELLETVSDGRGACVLAGSAGSGKTALAVHAAHRLADEFPGGRIFVRLREPHGGPRPLGSVAAELLGYTGIAQAAAPDPERAAALWRGWVTDRRVLLVLDDAPDEAAVRPLLPGTGRAAVVITARTQLAGLAPAYRLQLPPLSASEALELLGRLIGTRRLHSDPLAAERVVAACGALPLAVRAAGLKLNVLRHLTLAEYADRLADPGALLDELAVGDLRVRAHVADEWNRLEERHQAALRALAGLPLAAGFTAEQAAAALGADLRGTRLQLERLIEAGAVSVPDDEVVAHTPTYSLPYLTHLYARG